MSYKLFILLLLPVLARAQVGRDPSLSKFVQLEKTIKVKEGPVDIIELQPATKTQPAQARLETLNAQGKFISIQKFDYESIADQTRIKIDKAHVIELDGNVLKFGKDAPIVLHPIQPQARFGIMTDINVGSNAPKLIVTKTPFKVNGQKFNTVRLVEEAQGKYSARFGNTTHSVDEGMELVEDTKAYKVDLKHEDFRTGIKIYGKEGQHAMTAYKSGLIFMDETEIEANPYQTTRRYGVNTYLNPVESLKLTLSGVTDILSGAGIFMSLIPCENPFA